MVERLIPCPACNAAISSAAASCPKCGQPMRARTRMNWVRWLLVIVLAFVVFRCTQITYEDRQAEAGAKQ